MSSYWKIVHQRRPLSANSIRQNFSFDLNIPFKALARFTEDSQSMNKLNTRVYIKLEHTCHSLTFINDAFSPSGQLLRLLEQDGRGLVLRIYDPSSNRVQLTRRQSSRPIMNSLCAVIAPVSPRKKFPWNVVRSQCVGFEWKKLERIAKKYIVKIVSIISLKIKFNRLSTNRLIFFYWNFIFGFVFRFFSNLSLWPRVTHMLRTTRFSRLDITCMRRVLRFTTRRLIYFH